MTISTRNKVHSIIVRAKSMGHWMDLVGSKLLLEREGHFELVYSFVAQN